MDKAAALQAYQEWLSYDGLPTDLSTELRDVQGDEDAIFDRFYRTLAFGTGGLRGVLGAGTNRMNIYTVRRATRGLAEFVNSRQGADKEVVVGYDCRRMSKEFALEVGLVLAAAGVKAYVFEHLCPTPELSFAVRHLGAEGGVMITASHNPPEYNGYKVYDRNGCQILEEDAEQIIREINAIEDIFHVPTMARDEAESAGLLQFVGSDVDNVYCDTVVQTIQMAGVERSMREALNIVYTPLHGTGNVPVRRVLRDCGFNRVHVVPSQELPDGNFSTVKSPNPEEQSAFVEALALAEDVHADVVLGTDPDADRVGVAVKTSNEGYRLLTGNQVGGLLVHFVLERRKEAGMLPDDAIVFKTIVTSELGAEVARKYGVTVEDTLTGFKYIGDRIEHYQKSGTKRFLFGYEESYGYLAADFVRDKDAVQICLLVCEMAAYYKSQGLTLFDALERLYQSVGYFEEVLISRTLPGADGVQRIASMMDDLRANGLSVDGLPLTAVEDYESRKRTEVAAGPDGARVGAAAAVTELTLPQSNVLKYVFAGGSWLAVRPSGTEPKIKFYLGARGETQEECANVIHRFKEALEQRLNLG